MSTALLCPFRQEAHEAGHLYGSLRYTPIGRAVITASIADDPDAIFTPCRYPLSNVRLLQGPQRSIPNEIISFRGRFCEQAHEGELVYAAGTLERIENNQGDPHPAPSAVRQLPGRHLSIFEFIKPWSYKKILGHAPSPDAVAIHWTRYSSG